MPINKTSDDLCDESRRIRILHHYFKFKFNLNELNIFLIHDLFWERFNQAIEVIVADKRIFFECSNAKVLRNHAQAMEIVKDNGFAIGVCSFDLLKDFDLAMAAVMNEPLAYFFLDKVLRYDSGIAWAALKREPKIWEHLPEKLKAGKILKGLMQENLKKLEGVKNG